MGSIKPVQLLASGVKQIRDRHHFRIFVSSLPFAIDTATDEEYNKTIKQLGDKKIDVLYIKKGLRNIASAKEIIDYKYKGQPKPKTLNSLDFTDYLTLENAAIYEFYKAADKTLNQTQIKAL